MDVKDSRPSVAIIGSGISGLSCAYHLHNDFEVTIFEKANKPGGHTDTHKLTIDNTELNIDSGFIVYCREHYPNFSNMIEDLGVKSQTTNMSLSVHNQKTGLIYNGTSLNSLFCQRKNLVNPRFYRMLLDLIRFYRHSTEVLDNKDDSISVSEYLLQNRYSKEFSSDHLYPMISALWSATPERVKLFPIRHLVDFLSKHGMMNLFSRPEWRVINNGSSRYIEAIVGSINCDWQLNTTVQTVERNDNGAQVHTNTRPPQHFDLVIFASHADQTLRLLSRPTKDESNVLGNIEFETNHVAVHTDESIMHPNKLSWASWNAEVPSKYNPLTLECCTANYWMNSLQNLNCQTNIFTSLNSHQRINANKILVERHYSHPVFTKESVAAQKQKHLIDGQHNSYFVGAYWGWGFHEDGARSAAEVCQLIKNQYLDTPALML